MVLQAQTVLVFFLQLWICDTAKTAQNTTNSVSRIIVGGTSESGIDAVATDGSTRHSLSIGGDALRTDVNARGSMRKILRFHGGAVANDVAYMNNLIYTQGAFAGGVFGGVNFIISYWGLSILLNNGGWAGNGAGNNGRSYDAPYSSFTINMRNSGSTTFDKRLFTERPCGNVLMTGNLSIGNGFIYLPKPGNSTGTLKLGIGGTTGTDDTTNMKIEINGVRNGSAEAGAMTSRTYIHMKFYSMYHTAPQMFINGQQARIGIRTANT
jgi:hypothetical protein